MIDRSYAEFMGFTATVMVVCWLLGFASGCADEKTVQYNRDGFEAPVTRTEAWYAASSVAAYYESLTGNPCWVEQVYQGQFDDSNSMGQTVSKSAWLVCTSDFKGTDVNDLVGWHRWVNHKKDSRLHQVYVRGEDALRTHGTNNSFSDGRAVMPGNYDYTVLSQHYYRRDTE